MFFSKVIVTAALAVSALAAPAAFPQDAPAPTCANPKIRNAQFDELTAPAVGRQVNAIPSNYKDLHYEGFWLLKPNTAQRGIYPRSATNYAVADAYTTSQISTASVAATGKTKSFTLSTFYFGCGIGFDHNSAKPTGCLVTWTGYNGDTQVAQQSFLFDHHTGNGVLRSQLATFDATFTGLTKAVINYVPAVEPNSTPATLGFVMDDLRYTSCS